MMRFSWSAFCAAVMLACVPAGVNAQTYPSKPIKLIVPYAPGGLPDTVARWVSQRLTERLGQSVVVDNKPGGNGVVAYQSLLQSTPSDGHAFIVSDGSMLSITPQINKAATYRIGHELLPVSMIATSPSSSWPTPRRGSPASSSSLKPSRPSPVPSPTARPASGARTT